MESREWTPPTSSGRVTVVADPPSPHTYQQSYEVIGTPPNVAVPTHFAKVVLTSRPSSPSAPHVPEISTGAFVLPNAVISDETSLESFVVPSMSAPPLYSEHVSDLTSRQLTLSSGPLV